MGVPYGPMIGCHVASSWRTKTIVMSTGHLKIRPHDLAAKNSNPNHWTTTSFEFQWWQGIMYGIKEVF